jgi:hypothetical protein
MSIIKNIMGNTGDGDQPKKKAVAHDNKECTICQEAFQLGKDDYRIAHCVDCIDTGRVRRAAYWRAEFLAKKANKLSPQMEGLLQKLVDKKEAKSLLEGRTVQSHGKGTGNVRPLTQIQAEAKSTDASLETVRAQVMEYLPKVIAELGLTEKVDIELFADLIVPARISQPIVDTRVAGQFIRDVAFEEITRANLLSDQLPKAGQIQLRSKGAQATGVVPDALMQGGIQRLSAKSSLSRQVRADMGMPGQDAPVGEMGADPTMGDPMAADPSMMDPTQQGAPDMMNPMGDPGQMGGMDAGQPPVMNEVVGDVVRIPDDAGMADNADATMQQGGMPTMNEGIIPNSEEAFYNQTPDMGMGGPPQEGGVQRVQQPMTARVRALKPKLEVKAEPHGLNLFNVVGRVAKNVPVQPITLDARARLMLENAPATNNVVAFYSDGTQKSWSYHLTDKGAIFTSAKSEFYAETPAHFADYISTDPMFTKWAFLPEELQTMDDPTAANPAEMGLPGEPQQSMGQDPVQLEADVAVGEGDPSINELQPTVLNPSPGMMNQQPSILNNQDANVAPGTGVDDLVGDLLADSATAMLPDIQQQFPNHPEEAQLNHAVACAAAYLYGLYTYASDVPPAWAKQPGEEHGSYIDRVNKQFPGAQRNYIKYHSNGGDPNVGLEEFLQQSHAPQAAPAAAAPAAPRGVGNPGKQEYPEEVGLKAQQPALNALPAGHIEAPGAAAPIPVPPQAVVRQNMGGQTIDTPADKVRLEQYKSKMPAVAASLIQLAEEMGDMKEDEFMGEAAPGMVEAGYSDEEIMSVFAYKFIKEADGDGGVFSDYNAVTDVVHYEEPTEEAKRGLHGKQS